ncbi:hypothetical protein MHU86_20370 [Fragilaria crotonensis]|nr:hypothetical protein MHU86_20370 [Fragilaria crotonensis]
MDFFFVQGIPFYRGISRGIGFRTVQKVPDRGKAIILEQATRAVIKMKQQSRGFKVCDIHADSEFECIREEIRPVEMNIVPTDSHVGEIERSDEQPLIQERGLVVEWRPDQQIDESEYDRDFTLPRNAPADVFAPDNFDPLDADAAAADLLDDAAAHGLFIEPEDNLVALLAQEGADEDVNPRHDPNDDDPPWLIENDAAQPAVEDHDDDADDATVDHSHEDENNTPNDRVRTDDDSNGGAYEDDTNEGVYNVGGAYDDEGAHDAKGAYADDEEARGDEGLYDNDEAHNEQEGVPGRARRTHRSKRRK